MNKYDIKFGDYVETWDGGIGYVVDIYETSFKWMIVKPRSTPNAMKSGETTLARFDSVKNYYKRIGVNDFNEKKTILKPIERLDICYATGTELVHKLNELIEHINAIQERLNGYDSTRID